MKNIEKASAPIWEAIKNGDEAAFIQHCNARFNDPNISGGSDTNTSNSSNNSNNDGSSSSGSNSKPGTPTTLRRSRDQYPKVDIVKESKDIYALFEIIVKDHKVTFVFIF